MTNEQLDKEVLRLAEKLIADRRKQNRLPDCCTKNELISNAYAIRCIMPELTKKSIQRLVANGYLVERPAIHGTTYYKP